LNDLGIAENLEVRAGKLFSQRGDGGKSEDEIPDRPTADDEDSAFAHIARKTVSPNVTTSNANASRMALQILIRLSVAVTQFNKSRNRHGHMVR
jgi:hypothetical protein